MPDLQLREETWQKTVHVLKIKHPNQLKLQKSFVILVAL